MHSTSTQKHGDGDGRSIARLVRSLREQDGQSLIELAIVLPTLLLVVIGAVQFARVGYAAIEVSNAARAGVAYGAQNIGTAQDIAGMENAATNDGSNILNWKVTGLTATAEEICRCADGTATTCHDAAATCVSPTHPLTYVQVRTEATVDPLFYFPGLPKSYTLHGHAIMRVQ